MLTEIPLDLINWILTTVLPLLVIAICIIFPLRELYIFFKRSREPNDKLAMLMLIVLSVCLFLDFTVFKKTSLSELIYYIIAVATLSFFIMYNYRIVKMQEEVKNIQDREISIHEQELNLKLDPYLRNQNKTVYIPLVSLLNILRAATSDKNIKFMIMDNIYDIEMLKSDIEEILKCSEQTNQTDLKRINLINEIFENVFLKNIDHRFDLENQDEINKLKFKIINEFIVAANFSKSGLDILDENLQKDIKQMTALDLFRKEKECIIFYQSNEENLVFENGNIFMNQEKLPDYEKGKFTTVYTSEILIPLLHKYFENEFEYFLKIKKGIEKKADDIIPYDVSVFATEDEVTSP